MRARMVLLAGLLACANKAQEPPPAAPEPVEAAPPAPPAKPAKPKSKRPSDCHRLEQFGPVQLSADRYARRHGAHVTDLAKLKSSKERPVEVCHVRGEQEWLLAARCADGTTPLKNAAAVVQARVGSAGNGGRCRSALDLYKVTCPEATYEVYMDMFVCLAGSAFR